MHACVGLYVVQSFSVAKATSKDERPAKGTKVNKAKPGKAGKTAKPSKPGKYSKSAPASVRGQSVARGSGRASRGRRRPVGGKAQRCV
jgi:hypothetical protein